MVQKTSDDLKSENQGGNDIHKSKSVKVSLDIPEEFVNDFSSNRFHEFFERVLADMNGEGACGNYEKETAQMFRKAFANASVVQGNTEKEDMNQANTIQQQAMVYRKGGHR